MSDEYEFVSVEKPTSPSNYPYFGSGEKYRSEQDYLNDLISLGREGYWVVDSFVRANGRDCQQTPRPGTGYTLMQRRKPAESISDEAPTPAEGTAGTQKTL